MFPLQKSHPPKVQKTHLLPHLRPAQRNQVRPQALKPQAALKFHLLKRALRVPKMKLLNLNGTQIDLTVNETGQKRTKRGEMRRKVAHLRLQAKRIMSTCQCQPSVMRKASKRSLKIALRHLSQEKKHYQESAATLNNLSMSTSSR